MSSKPWMWQSADKSKLCYCHCFRINTAAESKLGSPTAPPDSTHPPHTPNSSSSVSTHCPWWLLIMREGHNFNGNHQKEGGCCIDRSEMLILTWKEKHHDGLVLSPSPHLASLFKRGLRYHFFLRWVHRRNATIFSGGWKTSFTGKL